MIDELASNLYPAVKDLSDTAKGAPSKLTRPSILEPFEVNDFIGEANFIALAQNLYQEPTDTKATVHECLFGNDQADASK